MSGERVRVLVVDDSAFARKVLRQVLSARPEIEVVGFARDGLEALERAQQLRPDVMTLDLMMPHLDGLGVLRALPEDGPRVVVVSISDARSALGVEALQSGAVELVHKPTALATDRLYEMAEELAAKVLVAARARPLRESADQGGPLAARDVKAANTSLVVIGTSTGGPQALTRLLLAMPGDLPVPVAVALHIPEGYTAAMARRLDGSCALRVVEAVDGMPLRDGEVLIAPGGRHLTVECRGDQGTARVGNEPADSIYTPSVDALFESAAAAFGNRVLGVVLTGMGSDGLAGSRAIREQGGRVLTEDASSCVVYGMPRSVAEAGLSDGVVPLQDLAGEIVRRL